MNDHWLSALLLPPGLNLVLVLAAWIVWKSQRRIGRFLLVLSATSLYVFSTPSIESTLRSMQAEIPPLTLKEIRQLKVTEAEPALTTIVVVGAGRKNKAEEYEFTDTVNNQTLEYLRYAAFLSQSTGLPLIAAASPASDGTTPEQVLMNKVLTDEFQVPVTQLFSFKELTQFLQTQNLEEQTFILVAKVEHCEALSKLPSSPSLSIRCSFPKPQIAPAKWPYLPNAQSLLNNTRLLQQWVGL